MENNALPSIRGGDGKLQDLHKSILRYVVFRYAHTPEQISRDLSINDVELTKKYVKELVDRRLLRVSLKDNSPVFKITGKAEIAMIRRLNILLIFVTLMAGALAIIGGLVFTVPNYPLVLLGTLYLAGVIGFAAFFVLWVKFRRELSGFKP